MRNRKVRILILTADAGFGHRSAANAVAEALQLKYESRVEAIIANPLDHEKAPPFLRDSQSDYDRWIKEVPELYKLGYDASDAAIPTRLLEDSLALLLHEAIKDTCRQYQPDVILTTYPMYQSAVTLLHRNKKVKTPFYTVVTDLSTVHLLWFHRKVDGCLVPNRIVAELAYSSQLDNERVIITGIPVSPEIARETRTQSEIRAELGWQSGLTTILAVGSNRTDKLMDALNVVNHYGVSLQLVVVAGGNKELYGELKQVDWHIPVHLYDYVDKMPALMKASDLIICKAGGLIVTESMASGLPMILTDVIPGQETGNAEYIKAAKAGIVADSAVEMLEGLNHLLRDDQSLLKQYAQNARALGVPDAAFKVADILWEAGTNRIKRRSHASLETSGQKNE